MAYRQSEATLYGFDYDGTDYGKTDPWTGLWSNLRTSGHGISEQGTSGGRFAILNETLYLTNNVVPEPTSMAIFGLGALGMAYRAQRKARAKAKQA